MIFFSFLLSNALLGSSVQDVLLSSLMCLFLLSFPGEFQCPVLNKVFTEFTHIVAVKTTGNVFCYEVC